MGILERSTAYNGTDDATAANATRLVCDSPALPKGAPQGAQPARVQVTNNYETFKNYLTHQNYVKGTNNFLPLAKGGCATRNS